VMRGPDEVAGGWRNPEAMGFATAVVYEYETDRYHFFEGPAGQLALLSMLNNKLAISFNGIAFDSKVIIGNDREVSEYGQVTATKDLQPVSGDGIKFYNFDILLEYIRSRFNFLDVAAAELKLGDEQIHDGSFSLDGLAEGTLNMNKTGHGANAPVLYQRQRFAELFEYNLHDVRLTKKLFDFISKHGYVVDRKKRKINILGARENYNSMPH